MMKTTHYICLFIFFGMIESVFAQIQVKGTVLNEDGESLPGVTVFVKSKTQSKNAFTDGNGNFDIALSEKGEYTITYKFTSFKAFTQKLQVNEDKAYNLGSTQLEVDEILLQQVEISGRKREDYNSDYSFSASKTAIKNKELPQAVTTVTKELIADRQAFQIAEAVKTVSSVTSTGNYNHFNIRGFTQSEEGQTINGMRTRQYYFLQPITSHLERVEVIKGPSSVTFSSVDPGGTVNMVTKKPLAEEKGEVSISAGSFSTLRATADITGPLNESKTLLYRFNTGIQEAQSFRDVVQNNAVLVSPSFSYIPNKTTALNTEIIYSNEAGNLDRGQPTLGAIDGSGEFDLNSTSISTNVGASSDYYKSEQFMMMTNFSKKITENFGFNASYMKQTWKEDLAEHRTTNSAIVDSLGNAIPTLVAMRYNERQQFWNTDNFNAYFNLDVETGDVTNKILVGYDASRWERTLRGGRTDARRYLKTDGTAGAYDSSNPEDYYFETLSDGTVIPISNVPYFDLENPDNGIRLTEDYITSVATIPANLTTSHGIYIQDQVKVGKFSALLNLRYEIFNDIYDYKSNDEKQYDNKTFIPRVGLTYELSNSIRTYVTYLQGVQAQSNTVSLSPAVEGFFWDFGVQDSPNQFDPIRSELIEIGAKGTFFNNRMQANFAAYNIIKENILVGNSYDLSTLEATGKIRSRGFEFDVSGYVMPNFQLIASYGFADARILKHTDEGLEGERTGGSAIHTANFWGKYDFKIPALKGLGIGLGTQYSGDKYTWYFYGESDRVKLPAYTVFDGALYYKPNNSDIQFSLKVNNLTNKKYWYGGLNQYRLAPAAPRNWLMTVTYKF